MDCETVFLVKAQKQGTMVKLGQNCPFILPIIKRTADHGDLLEYTKLRKKGQHCS